MGRTSDDGCPRVAADPESPSRGRFDALLQANLAINSDLSLPDVLRRIVASACRLTGARYGAIAVLDGTGAIRQMVHVGLDDDTVKRIGSLPEGKGLLDVLTEGLHHPLRLRRAADHPRAVGFPQGHPTVGAFLGIPIRVRDGVFGNLYVADPVLADEFTEEDEEVISALAATAGIAVENARLFEQEQRGREWLQATLEVTRSLLGGVGDEPLATVARAIEQVSQSDFVLVVLPTADDLMVEIAAGEGTEGLPGFTYPRAGSISAEAMDSGEAILVPDASTHPTSMVLWSLAREIDVGPLMFVPMVGHQVVRGVLVVGRRPSRQPFEQKDVEPALAFANHAALALELADGRRHEHRMRALEERGHLAAELHDRVLQRLFATGMSMQAIAGSVGAPQAERIHEVIEATDETIGCIRSVIQDLHGQGSNPLLTPVV